MYTQKIKYHDDDTAKGRVTEHLVPEPEDNGIAAYCKAAITDAEGNELVTENCKCPRCGERRMDWLICGEDDWVVCGSCATTYEV